MKYQERNYEIVEPVVPVVYDHLLAWKNHLVKLKKDIDNGVKREDAQVIMGPLSDVDAGMVDGLIRNYRAALRTGNPVLLINSLTAMQNEILDRGEANSRATGVEGRAFPTDFENAVGESDLGGKVQRNRQGAYISTFQSGIGPNVVKVIEKAVFSPGQSDRETDTNFFDDGIEINSEGIRFYNPSMGVDGELVPWQNSGSLSFVVDAPEILRIVNSPRRVLFGKPKPYAPVGVLRIYERSTATDTESPSKVRVLLENPQQWEELLNALRTKLGQNNGTKVEFKRPLSWRYFVRAGLWAKENNVATMVLIDRMLNKIYGGYLEDFREYEREIQRRESR